MTEWGHGAKSVHGVGPGYQYPCCGRRVRKYAFVCVYADEVERCEMCAYGHAVKS